MGHMDSYAAVLPLKQNTAVLAGLLPASHWVPLSAENIPSPRSGYLSLNPA